MTPPNQPSGTTSSTADDIVRLARASADRVATQAASDAGVDADLLGDSLIAVLNCMVGRRLSRAELDACRRHGEDAAERGVALPAVLDLYLSAIWRLWTAIQRSAVTANPTVLGGVVGALLRAGDDAAAALAEGFERAQRRTVRAEESLRREFFDDLLDGGADADLLHERAVRFGFSLAGTHRVLVAGTSGPLVDAGPEHARVEAHALAIFGGRDIVVATKEGLLVCALPGGVDKPENDLAVALADTGRGPWRIGVGTVHGGHGGMVRSYGEAREAHHLAERLQLSDPVARYADLLHQRLLAGSPALAAELVEAVLGPLRHARGGAGPLIETLDAHIAAAGNITATARALHLSPRAVVYRLDRIAKLSGHSTQDSEGRFVLELAVRCRRLVG